MSTRGDVVTLSFRSGMGWKANVVDHTTGSLLPQVTRGPWKLTEAAAVGAAMLAHRRRQGFQIRIK